MGIRAEKLSLPNKSYGTSSRIRDRNSLTAVKVQLGDPDSWERPEELLHYLTNLQLAMDVGVH